VLAFCTVFFFGSDASMKNAGRDEVISFLRWGAFRSTVKGLTVASLAAIAAYLWALQHGWLQ